MQTFLPYPDFLESARVIDRARLGKQRVEVIQILNCLHQIEGKTGWMNHPAVKMWRGHEPALAAYGLEIVDEWVRRGYRDNTCGDDIRQHLTWATDGDFTMDKPSWFGDPEFHLAHQSNLVRKDPGHYRQYFPDVPDDLPYVWPVA